MKVLALYLPQYHSFPENDKWWGEGYTEWTAVKRAKPLFNGHKQPRVPVDERYYDLKKQGYETLKWQAELAKKYGIYGFSIYQYWFCGKQLMEAPMEILLQNKDIDINYCICWANETWTRTWYGLEQEILQKQEYGSREDWQRHFDYCLKFFNDERYIKINNRPVLQIYRTYDIEKLEQMRSFFDEQARSKGFDGIYLIAGKTAGEQEKREALIDAYYYFEPGYSLKHSLSKVQIGLYNVSVAIKMMLNKIFKTKILERQIPISWIYRSIANRNYKDNEIPGTLARWDNTPRRSYKGLMYTGASAKKFEESLKGLSDKIAGRELDYVIINAFNEWGEGAMLEPEIVEGYEYLEAVRRVVS